MNSISESTILAFLADRNVSELAFFFNGWNHCLLRSYYDDETDFIYMLSGYRDTHELNEKAKLAGIYSHIHKALFAPCYDLARILPTEDISLQQIAHRLESLATERVILKVDGKPVPETDASAAPCYDKDYYKQYRLEEEARYCFYHRSTPVFDPVVKEEIHPHASMCRPSIILTHSLSRWLMNTSSRTLSASTRGFGNWRFSQTSLMSWRQVQVNTIFADR